MASGRKWTSEEDGLLIEQVAGGKTHAEIGAMIDRTRNAVNCRASFLGATMAKDAVLRHRADGRALFYSDAERLAARSKKYARTFNDDRRRELAERMRGNKLAVGAWEGKTYPDSAKKFISAIRSRQYAQQIGLPRHHPLRALYHDLMRKVGKNEARRIIRDEIARLSDFERQMIRVELGAGVARKVSAPSKSYEYTIGGVSS